MKLGAYCHYDTVKGKLKEGIGVMGEGAIVHTPGSFEFCKDYDQAVEDLNSCVEKSKDELHGFDPSSGDGIGFSERSMAFTHFVSQFEPSIKLITPNERGGGIKKQLWEIFTSTYFNSRLCFDLVSEKRGPDKGNSSVKTVMTQVGAIVKACTVVEL